MRKIICLVSFFCTTLFLHAQEIGFRLGDVSGGSAAVDAVFNLGKFDRVHANLSFGNGGVGADALWDFIYKPLDGEVLKWYVGVGPSLVLNNAFFLGASGEIGLEYRFKETPIVLGLDYRPTFWLIEETKLHLGGFGFNARYVF